MTEQFWPLSWLELDIERGHGMCAKDIASYAHPPGERERYTDDGWKKFLALVTDIEVTPALQFHDVGCVKRYGAHSEGLCRCEQRLAHNTERQEGDERG